MQSSREYQGDIRRLSKVNNAKKKRKTIEMGKTRDSLKKIGGIKGTLHAKVGTIKDRNSIKEAVSNRSRY